MTYRFGIKCTNCRTRISDQAVFYSGRLCIDCQTLKENQRHHEELERHNKEFLEELKERQDYEREQQEAEIERQYEAEEAEIEKQHEAEEAEIERQHEAEENEIRRLQWIKEQEIRMQEEAAERQKQERINYENEQIRRQEVAAHKSFLETLPVKNFFDCFNCKHKDVMIEILDTDPETCPYTVYSSPQCLFCGVNYLPLKPFYKIDKKLEFDFMGFEDSIFFLFKATFCIFIILLIFSPIVWFFYAILFLEIFKNTAIISIILGLILTGSFQLFVGYPDFNWYGFYIEKNTKNVNEGKFHWNYDNIAVKQDSPEFAHQNPDLIVGRKDKRSCPIELVKCNGDMNLHPKAIRNE